MQQQPSSSSNTPSASTSRPTSDNAQCQQNELQQQEIQQQQNFQQQQSSEQAEHVVYQQQQQQQNDGGTRHTGVSFETTCSSAPQTMAQPLHHPPSTANYQHLNSTTYSTSNNSYDSNNNNSSCSSNTNSLNANSSANENGSVTYTTLTTFRNPSGQQHVRHQMDSNGGGDDYVPNGGNLVFGLPPGLLIPQNGEDHAATNNSNGVVANQPPPATPQSVPPPPPHVLMSGANGLMPSHMHQPPHGALYSSGMQHPPHFQIPPQFLQNPHLPLSQPHLMQHLNGPTGSLIELKKDGHMLGPGGLIVSPSSSTAPTPSGIMNHHQPLSGHFPGANDSVMQTLGPGGSHSTPSSSAEDATDPYLCVWCTFKTIYKGNMKRHLLSCHGGVTDDLLRKYSFDVDRLRKLCPNRPHVNELPIMPKASRQSASQNAGESGGGSGDAENGTKPKSSRSNNGGSAGGRKRSTNGSAAGGGGGGTNGADNTNRGRPRKSAKGEKAAAAALKEENAALSSAEELISEVKQDMCDEVLRRKDVSSSSPSATSIPARLSSKASASSAAASPSLLALSSGVAGTSLISPPPNAAPAPIFSMSGAHPFLPPHPMNQLHHHPFGDGGQSGGPPHLHAQFGGPPPHTPLFMVMNPVSGAQQGAPNFQNAPQLFNPALGHHPLMISQSQALSQALPPPPPHLQQLDSMAGLSQPIYISSNAYQPLQHTLLPPQHQHQLHQLQAPQHLGVPPTHNFATLSSFKPPLKECSNDSGVSLHSFNTGVDL